MDGTVFTILIQDGVVNGAIYALSAMALVLVFTVTRVILIPQGELIAFGALTLVSLEAGKLPPTVWLSVLLGFLAAGVGLFQDRKSATTKSTFILLIETILVPILVLLLTYFLLTIKPGAVVNICAAVIIVTPLGASLYRIAFRPLADASVLVLLIAAVGLHLMLVGIGLLMFGPEGSRSAALASTRYAIGGANISTQALLIIGAAGVFIVGLYGVFEFSLAGKSLRATAVNKLGARLVGISTDFSGKLAFTIAAFISALSGVLCAPITTVYYDTGFLIGLKGFVGAIMGALVNYPLAAVAAIAIGLLESFASYWASPFKEVIVFTSIIPVLLWRSLNSKMLEDE